MFTRMDAPTPQGQLDFLQNVQRLLEEGTFTATYKFALLLALADLCVERGQDTGDSFVLGTAALAEKFIAYYWRQARPYPKAAIRPSGDAVLRQNTGQPAAVLTALRGLTEQGLSLAEAQRSPDWAGLVGKVTGIIRVMPLWKLQIIGQAPVEFLYPHEGNGQSIELRPGVMFCFRRFYGLVTDLVRGGWVRYVRRHNQDILGSSDLDQFLFGSERGDLGIYLPILREMQEDRCFYCGREVRGADEQSHIDHFIPWSRFPVDLGHNFVLAHGGCNLDKSDHLAATEHLARWAERNDTMGAPLAERFNQARIVHDLAGSRQIVRWAYRHACSVGAMTWQRGKQFTTLSPDWVNFVD